MFTELMSGKWNDALSVPVFDTVRIQNIWHVQRRHDMCVKIHRQCQMYLRALFLFYFGMFLVLKMS